MNRARDSDAQAPAGTDEVEFYGLPRQRAGVDRCSVPAGTLAQVLDAVAEARPGLVPDIVEHGRATRHVLVALDGRVVPGQLLDGDVHGIQPCRAARNVVMASVTAALTVSSSGLASIVTMRGSRAAWSR